MTTAPAHERFHWRPMWREGHRMPWGWAPHFVTANYDPNPEKPAGTALALNIGFVSEDECAAWIRRHLEAARVFPQPQEGS